MSDPTQEPNWVHLITGAGVMLLGWVGKRLHARQDAFEREYLHRREFTEAINQLREDRHTQHQENQEMLSRIHERVDQLWDRR